MADNKITKIYEMPANPPQYPEAKVLIYIDGQKCIPIRARTWAGMGLKLGDKISCDELKEREKFHWKRVYGQPSWDKEKVRLDRVKTFIEKMDLRVEAKITGFGADTNSFIAAHPDESGTPDIEVVLRQNAKLILMVEVTGTEAMKPGTDTYWVRPDKLNYAKNHPEKDVWIILHYAKPVERFIFIKPNVAKHYPISERDIRGSIEYYVEFTDSWPEVVSQEVFEDHLKSKLP